MGSVFESGLRLSTGPDATVWFPIIGVREGIANSWHNRIVETGLIELGFQVVGIGHFEVLPPPDDATAVEPTHDELVEFSVHDFAAIDGKRTIRNAFPKADRIVLAPTPVDPQTIEIFLGPLVSSGCVAVVYPVV